MIRKKSHEEFVSELSALNPDVAVVGKYKNAKTPIDFRCKICGHVWTVPSQNLLRGTGCPQCAINEKKKSRIQLVEEVGVTSPNTVIVGEYVNTNTPLRCKCKKCGYEWKTRPSVLLRGGGCPRCAGNAKRTHEEFIAELKKVSPEIIAIGKYINTDTKIQCQCTICGHQWSARPYMVLKRGRCPQWKKHITTMQE